MNDIVINSLESEYYQPNILIAIFIALYKSAEITLSKKNLGNFEVEFNNFINEVINSVKIYTCSKYSYDEKCLPAISKRENEYSVTLYIDKNKYAQLYNGKEISYIQQFSLYFKKYLNLLKKDELRDEVINMPSWETLSTNFLNSIDKRCNLKDYKIFGFEHLQAIAYYMVYNNLKVKKIEIEPLFHNNNNILEESSWNVKITLSLKMFFKYFSYNNSKPLTIEKITPQKYSLKEQIIINLVHEYMREDGCKIPLEDILEKINPDWDENSKIYKNYKKYVSNLISRLNKKYLHNMGHKLIQGKDSQGYFIAYNYNEEIEEI